MSNRYNCLDWMGHTSPFRYTKLVFQCVVLPRLLAFIAWRNVKGVMVDRNISRKLKGKVLDSCVMPASTYGVETLALSELHQHELQVCENNWIKQI